MSALTPVTFCEIFPPDEFPLYVYCWPKAPELEIRSEDLDLDATRSAGVFWVTVTGLSDEPSRTATLTALRARAGRGITVLARRLACSDAMPRAAEVEALVDDEPRDGTHA